jgi:diacylglycerol kinase family enzyme
LRYGLPLLLRKELTESAVVRLRAESLKLSASSPTPFEIDGEMGGHLPATVSVKKNILRILVPG